MAETVLIPETTFTGAETQDRGGYYYYNFRELEISKDYISVIFDGNLYKDLKVFESPGGNAYGYGEEPKPQQYGMRFDFSEYPFCISCRQTIPIGQDTPVWTTSIYVGDGNSHTIEIYSDNTEKFVPTGMTPMNRKEVIMAGTVIKPLTRDEIYLMKALGMEYGEAPSGITGNLADGLTISPSAWSVDRNMASVSVPYYAISSNESYTLRMGTDSANADGVLNERDMSVSLSYFDDDFVITSKSSDQTTRIDVATDEIDITQDISVFLAHSTLN